MKKGFTIIEIIVALTVFTIGVLGVQSFFAVSSRLTSNASRISTASNLAQGILDSEIASSYSELIPGTSIKTHISSNPNDQFYGYQSQINISLIDSSLNPSATDLGLKKIIVKVFYQESGSENYVELPTIITER